MGYETVDTASTFIGWGKRGQQVEIEVLAFDPTGGRNFNNEPCPRVVGRLLGDCDNYKGLRDGAEKVTLAKGDQVTVEGGIENLRKGLLLADPARGDRLRLTYTDEYDTPSGKGKVISVEIQRASDGTVSEDDI